MMPNLRISHVWFVFMVKFTGIILSASIFFKPAICLSNDALIYPEHWNLEVDETFVGNFAYKKLTPPYLRISDKYYKVINNLHAYPSSLNGTQVDLPTSFADAKSFSISFWILGKSRGPVISVQSPDGATKPLWIFIDRTGRLLFTIEKKTTSCTIRSKDTPFAADSEDWFHVVCIKDADALRLYINGFRASGTPFEVEGEDKTLGQKALVGGEHHDVVFSGQIADVQLYECALNPRQILNLAKEDDISRRLGKLERLLYFSFTTPRYNEMTVFHLQQLQQAGFTDMCARLVGAYETTMPDDAVFTATAEMLKSQQAENVWPMVFFNRFTGFTKDDQCDNCSNAKLVQSSDFYNINGLDIFDEAGALSNFYKLFKMALILARETGTPGVFIDPELYNCRDVYTVTTLSKRWKKSVPEIISQLKSVGYQLSKLCGEFYPKAELYFYFLDMGRKREDGYQNSIAFIAEGILEHALLNDIGLTVIDGWTGQYLCYSLEHLKYIIDDAILTKYAHLRKYPNLAMSAVLVPYESYASIPTLSWIKKGLIGKYLTGALELRTVNDFKLLYEYLFSTFKNVWFYGATDAGDPIGYEIFNPNIPSGYRSVLMDSLPPSN